jgi:hypothetical protein
VGWWQFIPEAAHRAGINVKNCKLKGTRGEFFTPTRIAPVRGVMKNAPYVRGGRCRISSCEVDERTDLDISTDGAMFLLGDAWQDRLFRKSGAAVQLTILSHNAGYDDSRFEEKRVNIINLLPAYKRHLKRKKLERAPDFYGDNITCENLKQEDYDSMSATCGGALWNHSQHYAYNIVAQHLLAVCYYGKNHSDVRAFKPWKQYARPDSYCDTHLKVPTSEEVKKRAGIGIKKG